MNNDKISLVVQWLRLHLPLQAARVQSLAGELRSHMLRGTAKTNKQTKKPHGPQKTIYNQCNLEKKSKNESITLPDFKLHYKATAVLYNTGTKTDIHQLNKIGQKQTC